MPVRSSSSVRVPAGRDRGVSRAWRAGVPGVLFAHGDHCPPWEVGADVVKVFPATSLGPGYIKDLRGPFPSIKLMPTGGVSQANAAEWIRAGAVAIGAGSSLVDAKAVARAPVRDDHGERARFVDAREGAR